jgi:tetratricopeptide (TPR) repeat protein
VITAIVLSGGTLLAARRSGIDRQPYQRAAAELIARKRNVDAHFHLSSGDSLSALGDRVTGLAHEAPVRAPEPLLRESRELRAELMSRLETAHGPRRRVSLCRLASVTSCVIADAQLSLSNVYDAAAEIDLAWRLAEAGDDDSVRVWCASARSWVAYLTGQPQQAVKAARAGHRYGRTESARQRLLSMEGSALALAGDQMGALEAFSLADNAREMRQQSDPVFDGIGGIFAASRAKQLQNEANGLTLLQLPGRAVTAASQAIELFAKQSGDSWDYSLEAGAWATLSISFLMLDRPDRAWEALQPVLALPPARRTSYVVMRLRDLLTTADTSPGGDSTDGQSLHVVIDPFITAAVAA